MIFLGISGDCIEGNSTSKKNRPLLLKGDLSERIESLLKEREGAYDVAEFTVDTGSLSLDEAVESIIHILQERNYL